jgi:peptidoglycan/LPS O-acetylase OafA/YrhL
LPLPSEIRGIDRGQSILRHYPNFDALRLLAAASVVFSHSFLIATGSEASEPLSATGRVTGIYGVFVFFILSGFLVTGSAKRSADLGDYFRKRFLRIAPGFVACLLLLTYAVCPFLAENGVTAFLLDPAVTSNALQTIFLHTGGLYFDNVQFYPPLNTTDFLPGVANGALWTIRLEMIGYVLVALLLGVSLLEEKRQILSVLVALAVIVIAAVYGRVVPSKWIVDLLFVLPAFCCGIIMNWLVGLHRPRGWIALICGLGLLPAAYFHLLPEIFCYLAAYPVIWLGAVRFPPFAWVGAHGDISYGVYLYGWPVTQLIRSAVGEGWSGYQMAAIALPATAVLGYLSWHLIEKPALSYKKAPVKADTVG